VITGGEPRVVDELDGYAPNSFAPGAWLANHAIEHLSISPQNVVLSEDFCSAPDSEFGIGERERPPLWSFKGRVFWKVSAGGSPIGQQVADALAWTGNLVEIIVFTGGPTDLVLSRQDVELTEPDFFGVASRINEIAVSCYDGAGFIVWRRRASGSQHQ
jgi:hypothetical protein